jgi:hypothetical protein
MNRLFFLLVCYCGLWAPLPTTITHVKFDFGNDALQYIGEIGEGGLHRRRGNDILLNNNGKMRLHNACGEMFSVQGNPYILYVLMKQQETNAPPTVFVLDNVMLSENKTIMILYMKPCISEKFKEYVMLDTIKISTQDHPKTDTLVFSFSDGSHGWPIEEFGAPNKFFFFEGDQIKSAVFSDIDEAKEDSKDGVPKNKWNFRRVMKIFLPILAVILSIAYYFYYISNLAPAATADVTNSLTDSLF